MISVKILFYCYCSITGRFRLLFDWKLKRRVRRWESIRSRWLMRVRGAIYGVETCRAVQCWLMQRRNDEPSTSSYNLSAPWRKAQLQQKRITSDLCEGTSTVLCASHIEIMVRSNRIRKRNKPCLYEVARFFNGILMWFRQWETQTVVNFQSNYMVDKTFDQSDIQYFLRPFRTYSDQKLKLFCRLQN
jgi:hypothetical protein